jgi:hypothetical protein
MDDRDTQLLTERISGSTLREIGERHGLSYEGVRVVVAKEGRKQIDRLELALLANRRTNDVELLLVPDHGGEETQLALAYLRWCLSELEKRGVEVRVHYRQVENGVAFGLEDVTDYTGGER